MHDYDLLVVGNGPGGRHAAITAARRGWRVALIDRRDPATPDAARAAIPTRILREAVLSLAGHRRDAGAAEPHHSAHHGPRPSRTDGYGRRERGPSPERAASGAAAATYGLAPHGGSARDLDGADRQRTEADREITIDQLSARTRYLLGREAEVLRDALLRAHVEILTGTAHFVDEHTLEIVGADHYRVGAERIVLAPGTTPARPAGVEFSGDRVVDSDGLLAFEGVPDSMVVVGAGLVGIEYASIFAALGTRVLVVEQRTGMLDFCDGQIVDALHTHLCDLGVTFRFTERVESVRVSEHGTVTHLASGRRIPAQTVLYSAGRQGATSRLRLENAGLSTDDRGRIAVDEHFRTSVPHIYAVGDVIGFPTLTAAAMEQGRRAAHHAMGAPTRAMPPLTPIVVHTIPQISYVGATQAELTGSGVRHVVGLARQRDLARGQITGDADGLLKLIVEARTRRLLGVHVFGSGAADLVHIGQAVMGCEGTVDFLADAVFNHPTLSEGYKVAALDAADRLIPHSPQRR